jgi:hypothetical protein
MSYVFTIDTSAGTVRQTIADRLTITKFGALRFYLEGRLAGAVRDGYWTRVLLQPSEAEHEPTR